MSCYMLSPLTGRLIYHMYVIRSQVSYNNQSKHKPFLIYVSHYICTCKHPLSLSTVYLFKLSLQPSPALFPGSTYGVHVPSQDPWQTCPKSWLETQKLVIKPASNPHSLVNPLIKNNKFFSWAVNYHIYYIVLFIATISSSVSSWSVNTMNAGMSCHWCVNVSSRHWQTEPWHNVYASRPSSSAVVVPGSGKGIE